MELPRRILVVDDDEDQIKVIRSQLMMYDFEVEDMSDPKLVIPHLRTTNNYGLFIIDVNMPGKDGITLATQIRSALKATTPILFVSGDISDETANRIRRLKLSGHVEFLKKGEYDSTDLYNECLAMLKDYANKKDMLELKGSLSHLQDNFGEGMEKITHFISEFKSTPLVTTESCDAKAEALIKAVRSEVIGISIGKAKGKIEEEFKPENFIPRVAAALTPEVLQPKLGLALMPEHIEEKLRPEVAYTKVRAASACKTAIYFLLIIFAGLVMFWGNMWNKAEHADAGVQELRIKHKQTLDTMQAQTKHIQKLLSIRPYSLTTIP